MDILERRRGRFHLVEVKSSTEVKEDHVADVAYQLHVLRSAGIPVAKAELMHLDRECAYPHLEGLFVREDLTGKVEPLRDEVSAEIAGQLRMLSRGVPDVPIGAQCVCPEKCPFIGRCWGELWGSFSNHRPKPEEETTGGRTRSLHRHRSTLPGHRCHGARQQRRVLDLPRGRPTGALEASRRT